MAEVVRLPLSSDLLDVAGTLAAGQIKRVSAATKIDAGVLSTVDGDDTPFSNASIEDETGATEMRGSFVDGQAWFHDAGGLVAAYAGTGNLLKINDGAGKLGYGFIGEVGTGETLGSELFTDPGIESWTGDNPDNLLDEGTPTVTDEAVIVHGGAHSCKVVADSEYDGVRTTNSVVVTPTKLYKASFWVYGDGVGEVLARITQFGPIYNYFPDMGHQDGYVPAAAWVQHTLFVMIEVGVTSVTFSIMADAGSSGTFYIDDCSIKEVTEPNANACHIYKEHQLANEGWNAIDTGIDYNADSSWDFDVYVNLMSSTAGTAQPRFEDGWLLVEPEGTNLILYSENFDQWTKTRSTVSAGQSDPRGGVGAYGIVSSTDIDTSHIINRTVSLANDINTTYSIFVRPGDKSWIMLTIVRKDGSNATIYFDLSGSGSVGTDNADKSSIVRLGTTDWYRVSATVGILAGVTIPTVYIRPAVANDNTSYTGDGTTIDTYVYGAQVEQTLFPTSYIPTNGVPVTRTTEAGSAADNGYSWTITQALKNILDDAEPVGSPTDSQGTLLFEVKWGCDESDIGVVGGLVSSGNSEYSIGYFHSNGNFRVFDGINSSEIAQPAFSAGDIIYYVSRWGDVDGNVNDISAGLREAGGAWGFDGTPEPYGGEFTLGTDLRLCFKSLYPIHIKDIIFYDVVYHQDQFEVRRTCGPIRLGMKLKK